MTRKKFWKIIIYTFIISSIIAISYGIFQFIIYILMSNHIITTQVVERLTPLQLFYLTLSFWCIFYVMFDYFITKGEKMAAFLAIHPEYRSLFILFSIINIIGGLGLYIFIFVIDLAGFGIKEFHLPSYFIGFYNGSWLFLGFLVLTMTLRMKGKKQNDMIKQN